MLSESVIRAYVSAQLESIVDPLVLEAITALLVPPTLTFRVWYDQSGSQACWVIAEHPQSRTEFVYSDLVFAVPLCWGIVNADDRYLGMDSNWFDSLERAFYDSFASLDMPIWNVIKTNEDEEHRVIAKSLTDSEAWALCNQLNESYGSRIYRVKPRSDKWW